ncbi:hypothetical protein EW146_g5172 [Bondarzewia mesenterica]|uniref:Reverse transcriptase/retrotransposon-derived protein RNase H-like domain-containing protein n=1 Tax=Bondarzewia mesenterica TaxID=1095465 RepID=A0A4S4LU45_9AGAM|nr:hypothetical protein EW146_g5172 [Bondarzewia mesenterica]
MGWTNLVPIFHDDVTFILQPEIPDTTIPYIDDVPIILAFVASSGNTSKVSIASSMVRHCCTPNGRLPEEPRVKKIVNWGPCRDLLDVRTFLGTIKVIRIFICNFAHHAHALTKLTCKEEPFHFRPDQIAAQENLKAALLASPALHPIDYSSEAPVILAVNTSHIAIGFHLCQSSITGSSPFLPFISLSSTFLPSDITEPSNKFEDWIDNVYGFLHLINSPSTSAPTAILSTYINDVMIDADTQDTPLMPTISYSDVPRSDNDHAADRHLEQVHN